MSTLSKRSEKRLLEGKKKFSFRNHGVGSHHAVPAVLMAVAGLSLSAVISDVPPSFNQAYASSIEENAVEIGNFTQGLSDSFEEMLTNAVIQDELSKKEYQLANAPKEPAEGYIPSLHSQLAELKKDEEKEEAFDLSSYVTSLSSEQITEKLRESEWAARQRELREASGQPVVSGNRNLYLDTYWYQRGPSNIPSTGLYTSCTRTGTPVSQMQMPSSLTFDENGVPENYLYCLEGNATAYYGGTMTATGSATRPGVVAVDPRIIPYGTEMWIVSADGSIVYGFARAEDTGGFIYLNNGPICDLYMNTYADCCVWGWRGVKIYVLPTSYK